MLTFLIKTVKNAYKNDIHFVYSGKEIINGCLKDWFFSQYDKVRICLKPDSGLFVGFFL